MNLKLMAVFVAIFSSLPLWAQELGKVTMVDQESSLVVFRLNNLEDVYEGNLVRVKTNSQQSCIAKVISVKSNSVVTRLEDCPRPKQLSKGQMVVLEGQGEPIKKSYNGLPIDPNLPSANESWYYQLSFHFPKIKYDSQTEDAINSFEDATGSDRISVGIELLSFYWPLNNHQSLLGISYNVTSDFFDDAEETSVSHYSLSASGYHFFGRNIGDGWYLRGDFGIGWFGVSSNSNFNSSDKGTSLLLGGGYAFPIWTETRLLAGLHHIRIKADGSQSDITSLNFGILF